MTAPRRDQQRLPFANATVADLIADLARIKCPLGCQDQPRFQGKRNRLHLFKCAGCGLLFEITPTPRPRVTENRGGR
jgi:hypothetical protein